MPVTLRPAEDADVSAMAAIRAQQWGDKTFWTVSDHLVSARRTLAATGSTGAHGFCRCR